MGCIIACKCIEIYEIDAAHFFFSPRISVASLPKKENLELLTDIDMLLMVEKGIRGRICEATHRYAKANSDYMNNYDKRIESSYLMHLDGNNLYGWAMSQKAEDLSKFNENFIQNYDENCDRGYFLEVHADYPKNVFKSHKHLPLFAERKKLINAHKYIISLLSKRKKLEKVEKLVCGIEDKEKHIVHIRALKQALNHGLVKE